MGVYAKISKREFNELAADYGLLRLATVRELVDPEDTTAGQLENVGRVLADLHLIGKAYKKGVDNRFGLDRVAEVYSEARGRLPHYFKRIIRTLDEEIEYLNHYLEGKLPKGI